MRSPGANKASTPLCLPTPCPAVLPGRPCSGSLAAQSSISPQQQQQVTAQLAGRRQRHGHAGRTVPSPRAAASSEGSVFPASRAPPPLSLPASPVLPGFQDGRQRPRHRRRLLSKSRSTDRNVTNRKHIAARESFCLRSLHCSPLPSQRLVSRVSKQTEADVTFMTASALKPRRCTAAR